MELTSKTERFHYFNSLVGVIKGLEGQYTTIDLQNEGCVTGKIKFVDGYMNVDLVDAMYYDPRGNKHPFETFFVRARIIRYVHIPKHRPALEIIENLLKDSKRKDTAKISTLRTKRAQRYQDETVKNVYKEELLEDRAEDPT